MACTGSGERDFVSVEGKNLSVKSQVFVSSDDNFLKFGLAERACLVLHQDSDAQTASCTNIGMSAATQCNERYLIEAKDALVLVRSCNLLLTHPAVQARSLIHHF